MRDAKLGTAGRSITATKGVAKAAMEALLSGPTTAEWISGMSSAVPSGTRLLGVTVSGATATVDLSGIFESGGGSLSMVLRLAQVTFTLTQFPTVSRVSFEIDGKKITTFGGEGIMLDHPATRSSFESVTPAIFLESPVPGWEVSSPLRIWGTANVFEAIFRATLIDPSGKVLVDQQITATSGTGLRGSFDATLRFSSTATGQGTLSVYDLSAKDGSRQDVVSIPVEFHRANPLDGVPGSG